MSKVKQILKYVLVAVVALCVVIMCAVLPPYFTKKNDSAFLGVVKKDTQASESYQYKATKYQKTKVLYEIIAQWGDFGGTWMRKEMEMGGNAERADSPAAESYFPDEYVAAVQFDVMDGKDADKNTVMTQAQAEMALVREARLLQSAGAIPHFDLGTQGDYSAVASIAFVRASDPTVSNSEFYFWQGLISNPKTGERYGLIIDDDIGKVYYMNIEIENETVQNGVDIHKYWDTQGLRKTADAFAAYHELAIDKAQQTVEETDFINDLYTMTNKDYEVMTEAQSHPAYQAYKMVLKPADLL